jgi:hypothetical protein
MVREELLFYLVSYPHLMWGPFPESWNCLVNVPLDRGYVELLFEDGKVFAGCTNLYFVLPKSKPCAWRYRKLVDA